MKGVVGVVRFALERVAAGERVALVTIVHVEGSSSREIGAHMAVSESGAYRGSLSGGCVEAAVVGEAVRVLEAGRSEIIRFGAGSPFIDIRLPCGGGLDLLFTPNPSTSALAAAFDAIQARRSAILTLDPHGGLTSSIATASDLTGWRNRLFVARHDPALKLLILGHGAETRALARLGGCYGTTLEVLSPDRGLVDDLAREGIAVHELKTPSATPLLRADPHTAIVFLFHDHDWESELIAQALATKAFFVGAMGSRKTHAVRLAALRDRGTPERLLRRLVAPLGLIPSVRDPETLALSALSQIVALRPPCCRVLSNLHHVDEPTIAASADRRR